MCLTIEKYLSKHNFNCKIIILEKEVKTLKIFKRFFPLIISIAILLAGIFLIFFTKEANFYSKEKFLTISFLIIGSIGTISSFFIVKFSKPIKSSNEQEIYSDLALKIKKEILKTKENENYTFEEPVIEKSSTVQTKTEHKNKKIKCIYCNCKFNSSLSRCPSCGAPPEKNNF